MKVLPGLMVGVVLAFGLAGCGSSGKPQCECQSGQSRCDPEGAGIQTCEVTDGDGCADWAAAVACGEGQTCADGVCGSGPTGLSLSGSLVPAAGVLAADGLRLTGVVTPDFDEQTSSAGGLSLEHGGFTSQ